MSDSDSNNNVTVYFTPAQWNLVFHVMNRLTDEQLNAAMRAAHENHDNVGTDAALTASRAVSQLINAGHPALYVNNDEDSIER